MHNLISREESCNRNAQVIIRNIIITELGKNNAATSRGLALERDKGKQPRCKIIERTVSHAAAHVPKDRKREVTKQVRPFDLQKFEDNSTLQTGHNLLSGVV